MPHITLSDSVILGMLNYIYQKIEKLLGKQQRSRGKHQQQRRNQRRRRRRQQHQRVNRMRMLTDVTVQSEPSWNA